VQEHVLEPWDPFLILLVVGFLHGLHFADFTLYDPDASE
jgi:hypothetical protein